MKELNNLVSNDLMTKHEHLLAQCSVNDGVVEKLKRNKNEIEKEIKDEYKKIVGNLKY